MIWHGSSFFEHCGLAIRTHKERNGSNSRKYITSELPTTATTTEIDSTCMSKLNDDIIKRLTQD